MIQSVTVINLTTNQTVKLTLTDPEASQGFAITSMDGLGAGSADINTSKWATVDGSHYNSAKVNSRTISMTLQFVTSETDLSIAEIRRRTYLYFPIKKPVRLIFDCYNDSNARSYYIDGYVEKNNPKIWSKTETASIEILCPDPYFKDTESVTGSFSNIESLFYFAFPNAMGHPFPISNKLTDVQKTLNNKSTISVGLKLTLIAIEEVTSPAIYNITTKQRMQLNYTMKAGEELVIDTRMGKKRIYLKDGYNTSKIQYLDIDSAEWIEVQPGDNIIGWDTAETREGQDAPMFDVEYELEPIYEGI